jgi:hypothetical protein
LKDGVLVQLNPNVVQLFLGDIHNAGRWWLVLMLVGCKRKYCSPVAVDATRGWMGQQRGAMMRMERQNSNAPGAEGFFHELDGALFYARYLLIGSKMSHISFENLPASNQKKQSNQYTECCCVVPHILVCPCVLYRRPLFLFQFNSMNYGTLLALAL